MKNKYYVLLFQYFLLFVIIFIVLTTRCSVSSLKELISNDLADKQFMESMYFQDNILSSIKSNGQMTDLSELQFDSPKLICYFSSQTCESCVAFAAQKIKEFFPDKDANGNIIFIAANFDEKIKLQYKKLLKLGKHKTGTHLDNSMHVCYFILQNGRIEHFFIPERNYSEYTDLYLKEIQKKYFEDIQ